VVDGKADESLLDSYEIERKPHVRTIVSLAKEFGKIIGELDLAAAKERDRKLRLELTSGKALTNRQKFIPDLKGGMIAAAAKAAGTLFPQPLVRSETAKPERLDDARPLGFAIVAKDPETMNWLSDRSLAAWRDIGGCRVIVGASPHSERNGVLYFQETDRLFSDWLAQNDIKAAIVRPDHYTFGGAQTADELNALVAEVLAGLRATSVAQRQLEQQVSP